MPQKVLFVYRSPYAKALLKREQERYVTILSWLTLSLLRAILLDIVFATESVRVVLADEACRRIEIFLDFEKSDENNTQETVPHKRC